jgi:hypothetical protein
MLLTVTADSKVAKGVMACYCRLRGARDNRGGEEPSRCFDKRGCRQGVVLIWHTMQLRQRLGSPERSRTYKKNSDTTVISRYGRFFQAISAKVKVDSNLSDAVYNLRKC